MSLNTRYIVGIDLGTTNCCVAYADLNSAEAPIHLFDIPQLIDAGQIARRSMLPSCCYIPGDGDGKSEDTALPWHPNSCVIVGEWALKIGATRPHRLIQGAKSWLSCPSADRRAPILPFEAHSDSDRLSPVDASANYLGHISSAWNHYMARGDIEAELASQEIIITVPASFDEVARTLTVEAAHKAGLQTFTLVEEPQAAFYAWLAKNGFLLETHFQGGEYILVCDVGGGTTDFSLIHVTKEREGAPLQIMRMAVGDHLLLGGDNIDYAIAYLLEKRIGENHFSELTPKQWSQLVLQARTAKEVLLDNTGAKTSYTAILMGSGRNIVQGSIKAEIGREELREHLLAGFFRHCPWEEVEHAKKRAALHTLGLAYEEETSIIKHLGLFLHRHRRVSGDIAIPSHILFNGGTMRPTLFQNSIVDSLGQWFGRRPNILTPSNLDLAVARGAAYYGKARRGSGIRIKGGIPRAYYLGIQNNQGVEQALTVLERGTSDESEYISERDFWLKPNAPVSFQLYTSHIRLSDKPNDLINIDEETLSKLPPVRAYLRYGSKNDASPIPVRIKIAMTPLGTLSLCLAAKGTPHTWTLEFQLRSAAGQEDSAFALKKGHTGILLEESMLKQGASAVRAAFADNAVDKAVGLLESLEELWQLPRSQWPANALRCLWDPIKGYIPHQLPAPLEKWWWHLTGYFLRPGYGYPLDDIRIKDFWKIYLSSGRKNMGGELAIYKWICYRRIAGGLQKGQQQQMAAEIMRELLIPSKKVLRGSDKALYIEKMRALGAFERLDIPTKIKIGNHIAVKIERGEAVAADYWALGRLAARALCYGAISDVIPPSAIATWIDAIPMKNKLDMAKSSFALRQMAQKNSQRSLNISEEYLQLIQTAFEKAGICLEIASLQAAVNRPTASQEELWGDSLPIGLLLEPELL